MPALIPPAFTVAVDIRQQDAGAQAGGVATVEMTTPGRGTMDLFDIDDTHRMSREEAAARLRALADDMAKNNSVEFYRAGRLITVRIPDEVTLKVEVELGDEGENELEVELTW
jgi:amphi-Trp domain-containing protein